MSMQRTEPSRSAPMNRFDYFAGQALPAVIQEMGIIGDGREVQIADATFRLAHAMAREAGDRPEAGAGFALHDLVERLKGLLRNVEAAGKSARDKSSKEIERGERIAQIARAVAFEDVAVDLRILLEPQKPAF